MNKTPYATFDDSRLPILVMRFEAEPANLDDFKAYLSNMEKYYLANDKLILIFDASKSKYLNADARILQGNWIKQHKEMIAKKAVKMIFVIPTITIRLIYKAILAIQPLPAPNMVVSSMEEAYNEAEALLAAA